MTSRHGIIGRTKDELYDSDQLGNKKLFLLLAALHLQERM